MTTPSEKPAASSKRRTSASAASGKAVALAAEAVETAAAAVSALTPENSAPPVAEPTEPVASVAPSPACAAAPVETVAPVVVPPAEPTAAITDSTPSQPLTSMVSDMTATPTFKGYDEIAAFGKANIDALIQANTVFTKGVEAISKEFIALTQSQLESAAAAAKAIFAAKTLKDMVELNAEFTKANFDKLVANSTKLGELSTKVATDTFAPISARVTSVVERAAKPVA